ncbi:MULTISPECIES: hypothetical protein [unclassified Pedobacter]|uniref:hypothetical protein n=1 Tax=unclassified Pedobacter TaxID=2628915 RepID=UPI001E452F2B|nr:MULTISPECIES: hypothetical protein [unclassified Pedobacter]
MTNQTKLATLQYLVMKIEMIKVYEPDSFNDILSMLSSVPQLQSPGIKLLLRKTPTEKNWLCLKYNMLEAMVAKVGDFLNN